MTRYAVYQVIIYLYTVYRYTRYTTAIVLYVMINNHINLHNIYHMHVNVIVTVNNLLIEHMHMQHQAYTVITHFGD